jgi:hypothetical protein
MASTSSKNIVPFSAWAMRPRLSGAGLAGDQHRLVEKIGLKISILKTGTIYFNTKVLLNPSSSSDKRTVGCRP